MFVLRRVSFASKVGFFSKKLVFFCISGHFLNATNPPALKPSRSSVSFASNFNTFPTPRGAALALAGAAGAGPELRGSALERAKLRRKGRVRRAIPI